MKKYPLWIFAAIVVALSASSLLWNFIMQAAGPAGRGITAQSTAGNPDTENFDIRDRTSKTAVSQFERRLEKFPSKLKERNAYSKQAMANARDNKTRNAPGLKATFSDLTNSPEIIEVKGKGRKLQTRLASQSRESVVRSFINDNADLFGMTPRQSNKFTKIADYTNPNGRLSWVKMEQRWNGLPVFRSDMTAAFNSSGELVRVVGELTGGPDEEELPTAPNVSAAQAVVSAAASIGLTLSESALSVKESSPDGRAIVFHPAGPFTGDIKLELLYFPLDARLATLAWSMVLWRENLPTFYTLVDAEENNIVLFQKNIQNDQTQPATYVIYDARSPAPFSPTTALPGSGIQGAAIPRTSLTLISEGDFNNLGWLTDGANTTTGNNVDAGMDVVTPDGIDPDGRPIVTDRIFDFIYNPAPGIPPPGDSPTLPAYRFGESVNMFFWTNRYHDRLYELGFTEAARNFQQDNFGRGGLGNDRVLAQGQDFSGTSNANFATPPDGSSGRMQMYIFNGPEPDRSSGLDLEVLLHELTHGTSNRLHNNAAGLNATMSGGMGEGWSDFYALSLLSQPGDDPHGIYGMGGYATLGIVAGFTDNYYYGIRRFPHATISTVGPNGRPHNPLTFADIDPTQLNLTDGAFPRGPIGSAAAFQVHNIGEVWCSALWEVRARIIDRMGFAGNQRMLQLVTDGMKLDPATPTLLDGRDSIISASCNAFGGEDELDIWAGFAARGMGASASAVSASSSSVVEAFDMPNLNLGAVTVSDDTCLPADGFPDPGESLMLNIPLSNPFCSVPTNDVTISVNGGSPVSYGDIPAGGTASQGIPFTVPADAMCGIQLPVSVAITSSLGTVTRTFNLQVGRPVSTVTSSYSSGNIASPIPDQGQGTLEIPVNVTDSGTVVDINVRLRLDHTWVGDLQMALISPDGTAVALANNVGGSGDNFGTGANDCSGVPTLFDDSAGISITAGLAPFAGPFRPASSLSGFNNKPVSGVWRLRITDIGPADIGTVGCVTLEITRQRFACCGVPGTPELLAAPPATVTNESCLPGNGAPDSDETVTVNFPLSNIGTGNTTNLVATLLDGGGVLAPSGPQEYGVVIAGGSPVAKPFTFTVAGVCGGNLTATLALSDGAMSLGTVSFTIPIGTIIATSSFSNPAPMIIPATGSGASTGAPANPYPSTINVSGLTGTITKVTAEIFDFNFDVFPDDVDLLLVGPGGQKLLLLSDVGAGNTVINADLTFDDAAPITVGLAIVSGVYKPTNVAQGATDPFPAPAPAGPYPDPQLLSVFNGLDPNGTWSLFAVDDVGGFIGNINGGWRLNVTTRTSVCCTSACSLNRMPNIVVNRDPALGGAIVNYPAPGFTGSCGVVTVNPPSGSFFPIGITPIMVRGTRGDGSTTERPFSVTVTVPTTTGDRAPQTQTSTATSLRQRRQ